MALEPAPLAGSESGSAILAGVLAMAGVVALAALAASVA